MQLVKLKHHNKNSPINKFKYLLLIIIIAVPLFGISQNNAFGKQLIGKWKFNSIYNRETDNYKFFLSKNPLTEYGRITKVINIEEDKITIQYLDGRCGLIDFNNKVIDSIVDNNSIKEKKITINTTIYYSPSGLYRYSQEMEVYKILSIQQDTIMLKRLKSINQSYK